MNKFKAGDILVCVDPTELLTKGKEYECIHFEEIWESGTCVINDVGNKDFYYNWHFELKEKDMEFTKKDLRSGYHVVTRNGDVYVAIRGSCTGTASYSDILVGITKQCFNYFENYDYDLFAIGSMSELDIMKVYEVKYTCEIFKSGAEKTLLWKRKEKSQSKVELDKLEKQIEEMKAQASKLRQSIKGENV